MTKSNQPNKRHETPQEIQNQSFDPTFGITAVLPMTFDGQNVQRQISDLLQTKVQTSGIYTYVAFSKPGTAEAATDWMALRVDTSGNMMFADANENFDNAASNLTLLNYSYS